MNKKAKDFLFRVLCGFFLGVSVVAPGVSGSVMAVMMGIYTDLIGIISNPFKNFKKNFFYLLPMGIGAIISFGLFIKILDFLFENYPVQSRILFVGLVAGGLPAIFKQANKDKLKWNHIAGMICALVFAAGIGLTARLNGGAAAGDNFSVYYLSLCGFVSGSASMIPGMSVSMVLMLLGVYDFLLNVASGFTADIIHTAYTLIPVGIFFLLGMVLLSKLTKFVFEKYNRLGYSMVFGFMIGTLISIFPNTMPNTALGWVGCVISLAAGLFVSVLFQFLGKRFNADEDGESTVAEPEHHISELDGTD